MRVTAAEDKNEGPRKLSVDKWPGGDVTKVGAVAYDYTQEEGTDTDYGEPHLTVGDRLHKGVFATSKPLTKKKTKVLFDAITDDEHADKRIAKCFNPHHGFQFYDKNDKVIGSISICLKCHTKLQLPLGQFASNWKFADLRTLLEELQVPILKDNEDYTEEYRKSKGQGGGVKRE